MATITEVKHSEIGGGARTTTKWDNGASRDVDRDTRGNVIAVTDHHYNGKSVTGDGVNNSFNPGGATRINSW